MNALVTKRFPALMALLCAGALLAPAAALAAREPPPEVSPDGLHLQKSTGTRVVYVRPGATFSQYDRVAIVECSVQFEKDWQKDYNASVVGLERRVTDQDVERMKAGLAAEFKKVFTEELQKGGYQVADVAAPDVLVLRPALINVEVNAPDLMTPGISATVVRSAGQMTLYLELWDAATNTLLARVMDAEADRDSFAPVSTSGVSNKAAADRILRAWAAELRKRLDAVRSPSGG